MIIVTGGAGMIGSNVVAGLNARGINDILVVDHLKNGRKMHNLAALDIKDYLDRDDFRQCLDRNIDFGRVEAIFHLGACSATSEWDGQFVMRNNFEYSKLLLRYCQQHSVQFLYASSASVYGLGQNGFREERICEKPINMYAYSKYLFDHYVRSQWSALQAQVVGFRYFNVYGPGEAHKGSMSSTPFHFNNQMLSDGVIHLFEGTDGYGNGEQQRDFVFVGDCVQVNLWFYEHPSKSGIFNVGTGHAESFNNVGRAVLAWHHARGLMGTIEYIPFPEYLKGAYQSFTQANISALRAVGYSAKFLSIYEGIEKYLEWLNKN